MSLATFEHFVSPPRNWLTNAFGLRSTTLSQAQIDALGARPVIVLSPHFDDACFSLGGLLQRISTGHLVNVFTQGNYVANSRSWPGALDQQATFAVRDAEDAAFAVQCRMIRHDLGCEEPSLRGRRPSDLSRIAEDQKQILRPVADCLAKISATFQPGQRGVLFAPLGVGRHVNHRAVMAVVAQLLPQLSSAYDVNFYEDLPYAGNVWQRAQALRRAEDEVRLVRRFTHTVHWPSKRALIQLYPSQLKRGRPSRLTPGALFPAAQHEAFWSAVKG